MSAPERSLDAQLDPPSDRFPDAKPCRKCKGTGRDPRDRGRTRRRWCPWCGGDGFIVPPRVDWAAKLTGRD